MLHALIPEPHTGAVAPFVPNLVRPLVDAAAEGKSLTAALQAIVQDLGFDYFMVGVGATSHPTQDTRGFVWTSLPRAWVQTYDQRSYMEIDPRLRGVWDSAAPLIWDRSTFADPKCREFLEAASEYGVCSGLALPICDPHHVRGIFTLSSSIQVMTTARRAHVERVLGQAMILTSYTYDLFLMQVVEKALPPPTQGQPLSRRETECIRLIAKGLSSSQAGTVMGITERTVEFHVGNLLSKLGATNRREAITKVVAAGLIEP